MKKQFKLMFLLLTVFVSQGAWGYIGPNSKPKSGNKPVLKAAGCSPATSKVFLEFNNVSALIDQGGSMFQNRAKKIAAYEVPKGGGIYAIYSGSLWMGGVDATNQLKLAAITFREGEDFWSGPLSQDVGSGTFDPSQPMYAGYTRDHVTGASSYGANITSEECAAYDKFYTAVKAEVIQFAKWWDCNQCAEVETPSTEALKRIYEWPAHGDITKGQEYFLAPFYDRDGDNTYDPVNAGDYPWYDDILGKDDIECGLDRRASLYGDYTYWWVFNDKGNIHTETNGEPIGLEVHAQAFAFATSDQVNNMTFYNYEIINRGSQVLQQTYFAQFIDPDLGNPYDDYVGCDVSRGLGYAYNADNEDETNAGKTGYGFNPPAIGVDFFEGPYQDADGLDNVGPYTDSVTGLEVVPDVQTAINGKGIVYKGIGIGYSDGLVDNERFGMRLFTFFTGAVGNFPYGDPSTPAQYYNYMRGKWQDGSTMVYGGMGNSSSGSTIASNYMFPGDSDPLYWSTGGIDMSGSYPTGWDETTGNNAKDDRRFVQAAGPFVLNPGAVNNITVGVVYARSYKGGLFASVNALKTADTKAQNLFDACFKILDPPNAPKLTIQELDNELILMLENPITSNNYNEEYKEMDEANIPDEPGYDRYYHFQGYQIFQMIDGTVGAEDISDYSKARLVAQCDIKDSIGGIVNFNLDSDLGYLVPQDMMYGATAGNSGIKHSFRLTKDLFASGANNLVNHKKYYYIAVAYAYNQYKEYDPYDGDKLDGQQIPYIVSRLAYNGQSISSVEAIPHNPTPEAYGTNQIVSYGSSPRITRLDGHGNGGNAIEFTTETLKDVLENGYVATPEYEYNAGPLNIKVVDPLNVAKGYFEIKFEDYTPTSDLSADTASWTIYRYDSKDGNLIDQVSSERTIGNINEQLIPEWGISVSIYNEGYTKYLNGTPGEYASDIISSSVTFTDSNKAWLTFVQDDASFTPFNWIRSGTYAAPSTDCISSGYDYNNPCNYKDEKGVDDDLKYAKILNGGIAPYRLVGCDASFMPMTFYNSSTYSNRTTSSLAAMPSVNIVITKDTSLWTRCPVLEMGRNSALNYGNAIMGGLRKSSSVDKNGNPDGSGTIGLGWFPGYAVDLETGARLYMAFGENSYLASQNGRDMIWNPTSDTYSNGFPVMGGVQPIYVYSHKMKTTSNNSNLINFPAYVKATAQTAEGNYLYQQYLLITGSTANSVKNNIYTSLSWIVYPLTVAGHSVNETDVKIALRHRLKYKNYTATGENNGKPMYSWTMDDIATVTGSKDRQANVLDMINVVPNPYYAYSEYETGRLDTRVKITNLPVKCTVRIYTSSGKLIRTFKKDTDDITSLDWDLTNEKFIPVTSGVYFIHVDVPDTGEKILKFFCGMRQVDLQGL